MDMPFEFCALRYLLQWERKEKGLHARMKKTPGVPDIRSSLQYFQVARNFAGLKEDSRAQSIADLLASVDSRDDHTFVKKVDQLATRFKGEFKQFNLSAASKLLWLKHKRPYILYDSRAIAALKNMGCDFHVKSYAQYCQSWRNQYKLDRPAIQKASARLVKIRGFLPAWHADKAAMSKLVRQPWFLERVFDIYLWELGVDG